VLERGGAVALGLVALGFTSVYREGFEVVLFLQSLELQAGTATVLQGVAIGLAGTAVVGVLTFWLHQKLPYRRMLVLTGVLLAVVLVVMTGGTAATFQDLGWLPATPLPFEMPGWLGAWFEIYGTYEGIACQLGAAILVVGSYVLAEQLKVRRPARQGAPVARRAEAPPASVA
jgi:high-affinity iron transporter